MRTVRIVRRRAADPAFPPDRQKRSLAAVIADITSPCNLNPARRLGSYPRVIRRAPAFFESLAGWLNANGGRSVPTFFPPVTGRPHSVPWDPPQGRPGQPTIDALNDIQSIYG